MIAEVARREIVTRGRSKAYRISTVVLLLVSIAFVVVAVVVGGSDDEAPDATTFTVGLTEPIDGFAEAADEAGGDVLDFEVVDVDSDEVADDLASGDLDAVIRDGTTLVFDTRPFVDDQAVLASILQELEVERRAAELGVDPATLDRLVAPADITTEILDPVTEGDAARTVVATIGIFVMFLAIQLYGGQIAMVVVEEKANRIVEILLALVRPRDLLTGKIIGVGVLAALQVAILVVGMFVALAVSGTADIPASAYASLPLLFVVFVLGFTMYGTLFALVGSLVSRQEDAQQALFPVFVPIVVGYLLALQAVSAPDSPLATIASIVPLTSPFALPVTVAEGTVGPVVIVVSLALLVATTAIMLAFAARVYEFTLLRTGNRIRFVDTLRIARTGRL